MSKNTEHLNLVLSPVGTSFFMNLTADKEARGLINKSANLKENEISEELKQMIHDFEISAQEYFEQNDKIELKKLSAELNSLLTYYKDRIDANPRDVHVLVATDTFLGKKSAEMLENYLEKYFESVYLIVPQKLSTKTKANFDAGVRDLLKWCDEKIKDYKNSGYKVVFNLTGGFKSLQGYLSTIGMFYADEIIYIFEKGGELINIPKLPIQIESELFKNHASLFLQLSKTQEGIAKDKLKDIPEIMIEKYQNNIFVLSNWGELSWNNAKEEILSDNLIELPFISYENSFLIDFQSTKNPREKIHLQETIAFISCRLQESEGDISILKAGRSGGIKYDNYSTKNAHLGHFRLSRGLRVSCEYVNRQLKLRHYGQHDYVNDNP